MVDRMHKFDSLCDLLPEGVHWSDPITPQMLQEIVDAIRAQADAGPVAWITKEQLQQIEEWTADAWVYWRESGHVAEPDELPLFLHPSLPAAQGLSDDVLANLVNAVRWWGSQEDGIPAEVAPAFNAAHLALGWSLTHPMDFHAAKQASHEWDAEGERCLKCGDKDWFASITCSSKAAQQQAEPVGDERAACEVAWNKRYSSVSFEGFGAEYLRGWLDRAAQSGQRAGVADEAVLTPHIADIERMLDADEMAQRAGVAEDAAKAIRFAGMVFKAHRNDGSPSDVDGDHLQRMALECGLIEEREVSESCGANCSCADVGEFPSICYFNTKAAKDALDAAAAPTQQQEQARG